MHPEDIQNAFNANRAGFGGEGPQEKQQNVEHKIKSKPEKVKCKFFTPILIKSLKENHALVTTNIFSGQRTLHIEPGIRVSFFVNEYVFYDLRLNATNISARKIKFADGDDALVDFFYTWKIADPKKYISSVGNNMDGALDAIAEQVMSDVSKVATQEANFEAYRENIYTKQKNNDFKLITKETAEYVKDTYGINIENIMTKDLIPSRKTAELLNRPTQARLKYTAKKTEAIEERKYLAEQLTTDILNEKIKNTINLIRAKGESACDTTQIANLIAAFPDLDPEGLADRYFQTKMAKNGGHINYTNVNIPRTQPRNNGNVVIPNPPADPNNPVMTGIDPNMFNSLFGDAFTDIKELQDQIKKDEEDEEKRKQK